MAKDGKPDYFKTGFTAIACVAAIVLALAWCGGYLSKGGIILAETWYDAPVSGLSVGSAVDFRGVKIGQVKSISFIGSDYASAADEDSQKVRIVLAIDGRLVSQRRDPTPEDAIRRLVRKGVRASVASSGITGLSKVELNYPKIPPPDARLSWTPEYVCIPPSPSILESFTDSVTKVMNHLNKMDLSGTGSNIVSIVSSAAKVMEGAGEFVETRLPALKSAVDSLEDASETFGAMLREVRDNPSLLIRPRKEEPLPETEK